MASSSSGAYLMPPTLGSLGCSNTHVEILPSVGTEIEVLEVDEDGQAVWLAAKSLGEVPAGLKVEFEVDGTTSCLPLDVIDSSVRPKGGRARVATSAMPRKSSSPARDSSGDNRSSDDDSDYDDDCTSRHIKASKRTARAVVQPEVPLSNEGSKKMQSRRKRLAEQLGDFNKQGPKDPFPSAGPTDAPIKLPVVGSTIKLLFGDGITLRWYDAEVERMATGGIVCRFLSDDDGEAASTEGLASSAECKKKRKSLSSVGSSTMVPWDDIDARVKIVRQATVTSKKSGVDAISSSSRSGFASNRAGPSYYGWQSQPDAPLVNLQHPKSSSSNGGRSTDTSTPRPQPLPRASSAASNATSTEMASIRRELARTQARNEKLTATLTDAKATLSETKQRHREELSALRTRAQDKRAATDAAEKALKLQAQLSQVETENRRLNLKNESLQARLATAETTAKAAARLTEEKAKTNAECLAVERQAHMLAHERQLAAIALANGQNTWLRARIAHFETERSTAAAAEVAEDSALLSHASGQEDNRSINGNNGMGGGEVSTGAASALAQFPPPVRKQRNAAAARAADIAAQLEALGPEPAAPSYSAGSRNTVNRWATTSGVSVWQEPPAAPPVVGPLKACGICLGFLPGDNVGSAFSGDRAGSVRNGSNKRGDNSTDVALLETHFSCQQNGNKKIVERYSLTTGHVLEEYSSMSACASKLGTDKGSLSKALRTEEPTIINEHAVRYKSLSAHFADSWSSASDHRSTSSVVREAKIQKPDTRVQLSCGHWFCGECVLSLSASQVDDVKLGRVTRKAVTVQCPFCRQYCREDLTMV